MLLIAEYVVPVSSEPIEHGAVFIKDGAIADIGDAEMMRLRYPNEEVKDFGMEFFSDGRGGITYLGLSLFEAEGSAYTGNMLASESVKSAAITACLPGGLLDSVRARIQQSLAVGIGEAYTGPFGIDMMVVEGNAGTGFLLHPCVEINLRRTMGHVALSLTPADENAVMTMRIAAGNNCKLKIQSL